MSLIKKLIENYDTEKIIKCDKKSEIIIEDYLNNFKNNFHIEEIEKIPEVLSNVKKEV